MSDERPNLLVIMSDQHRHDAMGCAGHPHVQTPTLDVLAARGTRFTHAYCNNPICVPSRLSFLSGKTTNQIGVWSLSDELRSDELTWPALLGAGGYDTAISGRMHHWWADKLHGFHRRVCGENKMRIASGTYELYEPGSRRDEQMAVFQRSIKNGLQPGETGEGPHAGWRGDREATDGAIQYIEQEAGATGAPWALCVGYLCPHSPLRFPAEYYDRYRDTPVDDIPPFDDALPEIWRQFARTTGYDQPMDQETAALAIRAYYAMVTYVDDLVADIVAALDRTGYLDNTIIVYTTDHGEMLGERGLWYKNQLLESAIRIPMIAAGPGIVSGATPDQLVSLMDLFPTFRDLCDAPSWNEVPGRSLAPLLRGESAPGLSDRPVFIEYADYGIGQPAACIRRRNLKLVAARNFDSVLFDLDIDPGETTNRYNDPSYADAVRQLERDMATYWDADDTYRRVVRNQNRIDLIRSSRNLAKQRGTKYDGGILQ